MPVNIGSLISNGGSSQPAGMSGGWGDWLPLLVEAGTSLAGGWLSSQGNVASANANADAAQQVVDLQRGIYNDQRALSGPGYLTGGAATNALASIYGLPVQDYAAAFNNGGGAPGGNTDGAATNWGAGRPVVGHSGGGGSNALASAAGSIAGSAFGPIGSAVGGALGGLVRNGGDNWTTLATSAPEGYNYDAYFASDPGLAREWSKADVRSLFNNNRDAYLYWHARGGDGNWSPSSLSLLDGYEAKQQNGVPTKISTPSTAGTGSNALTSPMKAFEATPYYDMAVKGFRGVDTPEVNSAYARGGKVLSGAQSIALDERGKNRLGGAFGSYVAGLSDLAGLNSTAATSLNNASTNYGANAGNAITNAGQAKGNALASGYAGLNQGVSGALNALTKYGQNNWGWA